jgi:uncharacterized Ntn-hydrolase superfamily protein
VQIDPIHQFSTYSIVARDPETGQLGVGVQTHQMCVGAIVPWLLPGQGALATQSVVNIRFGPMGLNLLGQGISADAVVDALVATDAEAHRRQLGVVDVKGVAAAWTGEGCIPFAKHLTGEGFSVQANMMLKPGVVEAMVEAYTHSRDDFVLRILKSLEAAQSFGGDIRGMQSAAIKIVEGQAMDEKGNPNLIPRFDLRVDEHDDPLFELARLVRLRRAALLNREGHECLDEGDLERAMELWETARELAPDLEELQFWQALAIADSDHPIDLAVGILKPILERESNRENWIDLIRRLEECGMIEHEGTAENLITALDI